jgi:hypothetical protein
MLNDGNMKQITDQHFGLRIPRYLLIIVQKFVPINLMVCRGALILPTPHIRYLIYIGWVLGTNAQVFFRIQNYIFVEF